MQLHNKDCMAVLKDMPDESIDLIVTDPPYKVTSYGIKRYSIRPIYGHR